MSAALHHPSPVVKLAQGSWSELDTAIRDLIAKALAESDGWYTFAEVLGLLISAASIVVEILRGSNAVNGLALSGVDKKAIAIQMLEQLLDALEPKINQGVMALIAMALPWWLRWVPIVVSVVWNPSVIAALRAQIPAIVQAAFDGLSVVWNRRAA